MSGPILLWLFFVSSASVTVRGSPYSSAKCLHCPSGESQTISQRMKAYQQLPTSYGLNFKTASSSVPQQHVPPADSVFSSSSAANALFFNPAIQTPPIAQTDQHSQHSHGSVFGSQWISIKQQLNEIQRRQKALLQSLSLQHPPAMIQQQQLQHYQVQQKQLQHHQIQQVQHQHHQLQQEQLQHHQLEQGQHQHHQLQQERFHPYLPLSVLAQHNSGLIQSQQPHQQLQHHQLQQENHQHHQLQQEHFYPYLPLSLLAQHDSGLIQNQQLHQQLRRHQFLQLQLQKSFLQSLSAYHHPGSMQQQRLQQPLPQGGSLYHHQLQGNSQSHFQENNLAEHHNQLMEKYGQHSMKQRYYAAIERYRKLIMDQHEKLIMEQHEKQEVEQQKLAMEQYLKQVLEQQKLAMEQYLKQVLEQQKLVMEQYQKLTAEQYQKQVLAHLSRIHAAAGGIQPTSDTTSSLPTEMQTANTSHADWQKHWKRHLGIVLYCFCPQGYAVGSARCTSWNVDQNKVFDGVTITVN